MTSTSLGTRPVGEELRAPASFGQQRVWFLEQLAPDVPVHNVPVALRLDGPLVVDALEDALAAVVARHEPLRTSFAWSDGRLEQVVHDHVPFELRVEHVPAAAVAVALREEVERVFDLGVAPLARALLLRLAPEEHVLALTLHHTVADGWSLDVLLRELAEVYSARVSGRTAELPELRIQYADYAQWQHDRLQGETLEAQLRYWEETLEHDAVLDLPVTRPSPPAPSFRGAVEHAVLPEELAEPWPRSHGVT
jgi:Condensation domain